MRVGKKILRILGLALAAVLGLGVFLAVAAVLLSLAFGAEPEDRPAEREAPDPRPIEIRVEPTPSPEPGPTRSATHAPTATVTYVPTPIARLASAPDPTSKPTVTPTPALNPDFPDECARWGGEIHQRQSLGEEIDYCVFPGGRETPDHFRIFASPRYPTSGRGGVTPDQRQFAAIVCQELHLNPDIDDAYLHPDGGACKFDYEFSIVTELRTRDLCDALGPIYKWNREFDRCEAVLPELEGVGYVIVAPTGTGFIYDESTSDPAAAHHARWWIWLHHT